MEKLRVGFSGWRTVQRDPRYVVTLVIAAASLTLISLEAAHTYRNVSGFDVNWFRAINGWPGWLLWPFYTITQFGSLTSVVVWGAIGVYKRNVQAGLVIVLAGLAGWLTAKPLKAWIDRPRPGHLLHHVQLLSPENFQGLSYPSGHATVSSACVTALYFYISPRYRKYLLLALLLIGLSRIYLGGHFPTDILGGWALGALVGSLVSLIFGTQRNRLSMSRVKKRLLDMGITAKSAKTLSVDARGSIPVLVEDESGKAYFVKLFGKQEHAADWIFKTIRFFRFKSFTDEEPFFNSKRNVEHEASGALWAAKAGVQTPDVKGYGQVGSYWMLVQDAVDAVSFDKLPKDKITDTVLENIWQEVKKLHDANIAHRDLRSANMLVTRNSQVWLIDFGFAEVAASLRHRKMDVAELLMSMSLIVGSERTLKAARKVLGEQTLASAAPYVQMAVFSGATTSAARKHRDIYKQLRAELADMMGEDKIDDADVVRLKPKLLINVTLIGLFLFLVVPQFNTFKGSLESLKDIDLLWLLPLIGFSLLTYVSSAMGIVTLSPTPLKIRSAILVQMAGSFASKLLPSGLGSAALLVRFLRKSGLDDTTAASLVVVQRVIDFVMFMGPLLLLLLFRGGSITKLFTFHISIVVMLIVVAIILIVAGVLAGVKKWRAKIIEYAVKTYHDFQEFASSPRELALTALFSFGVTLMYVACLYIAMETVGLRISLLVPFIVYATATIAGSASPAPGGLGALEIAMVATMIGIGLAQPQAYAAVILYRLITYWVPVPFGFVAYQVAQKKNLV